MASLRDTRNHKVLRAERKRATLVVVPAGDAAGFRCSDVENELKLLLRLLDEPEFDSVVVDLGTANYFGTTIIGCITSLGQKAEEAGGQLAICNSSQEMREVMRVMHLDERWPHFESRRAALKALS